MAQEYEYLRDVYVVTEYAGGDILTTKFVEQRWVDHEKYQVGDYLFTTPKLTPEQQTIRKKK